ncbi:MAG: CNNM domain-containing protein [Pirellulaceae bacterium]|nr:CNNM domain-containing protein [Pirellulaceae bacterium]
MIFAVVLFLVGVFLSAFFSGSETGFYRATRVRLTMDAMSGDLTARSLLWLTNNPSLFVATTLIGNNLANYLTSLAIVLASTRYFGESDWVAVVAPIVFSPLVFVYGELLPKNLFFQAPNRLLSLTGPLFVFCAVLFMPVSAVLWLLGRALTYVLGESAERLQLSLARKELQRVFDEGHQVGILRPAQRQLAQAMMSMAMQPLQRFSTAATRFPSVHIGSAKREAYRLANRQRTPTILVTEARGRRVIGYVDILDLKLDPGEAIESVQELLEIPNTETPISALTRLQDADQLLARLVDDEGRTTGLLNAKSLVEILLREVSPTR